VATELRTREEAIERRWEAAPAVLAVIALQLCLALVSMERDWKLWRFHWWVWTVAVVPEAILLVSLAWDSARRFLERIGHRRNVALALLAVISLDTAVALVALIASLVEGKEASGAQLLLKGITIWGTNVMTYALWFWGIDRGGPVRRGQPNPPPPDFQFPQMENPQLAVGHERWRPGFIDYLYTSLTNATAFSPTDTMPLTVSAKLVMALQSVSALVTVGLVVARAVNILS
jgi:uncharacterized membrane protein